MIPIIHKSKFRKLSAIPLSIKLLFCFLIVLPLFWNIYTKTDLFSSQFKWAFRTFAHIDLEIKKVNQISFLYGFDVQGISVRTLKEKKILFEVDRITCSLSIFGFLVGDFGIKDFVFDSPKIYIYSSSKTGLIQNTDIANLDPTYIKEKIQNLIESKINNKINNVVPKPENSNTKERENTPKKEEQKEIQKPTKKIFSKIYTILPLRFYLSLQINNMSIVFIESLSNQSTSQFDTYTKISNIFFQTAFITKRQTIFAIDFNFFNNFDIVFFSIRPDKWIQVKTRGKPTPIQGALAVDGFLIHESKENKLTFLSKMNLQSKGLTIIPKKSTSQKEIPMPLRLQYLLAYNPNTDRIVLSYFAFRYGNDSRINCKGAINHTTESYRSLDLRIFDTNINLEKISDVFLAGLNREGKSFFMGQLKIPELSLIGFFRKTQCKRQNIL